MTGKRGPYSSPRQRERRLRILRNAGIQVEAYGYSGLSMQSIADASEVSVRTLYNVFGSLDALLLDAADQLLDDLRDSVPVLDAEPGIPRLLTYAASTMSGFVDSPEYARSVIAILLRADLEPDVAYRRFGPVQRFAHESLQIADHHGELRRGADLLELSWLVSANEWGAVLLWEKGLLAVGQLERQITLNNCLTLLPVCTGERRQALEERIDGLMWAESPRRTSGRKHRKRT